MHDVLEQRTSQNERSEDTIVSRFERQAAAVPDRPALVTGEISLTFRALDLKANHIAATLASLPCRRSRPIVLLVKNEAARIAAMLGVLKANCIFVPLGSDSPEKWIAQVIEDSGAAQVIVDSPARAIAERAAGTATVLDVDQLAASSGLFTGHHTASPDDTAYIVYTSGSTGRPKGVAISHRSSIRRTDIRHSLFKIGPGDRHANLRSSGVSAGINETFLALLSGTSLFPFDLQHHGLQKLAPWLFANQITYIPFSASLLRTWLASLPDHLLFPALRFVWVASEQLYGQDVIRVSKHLQGDWRIGYSYSSTETGTISTQVFSPSHLPEAGIIGVGRPVDGVDVRILDETGASVAPGETGTIVVRSRFLAQGYWNNPDLTATVFQTDPLDNTTRLYHTSDLGRQRSDGTLEHLGRKGRSIRLRGYSIEPFEVERALIRHPGVSDAIVVLHESTDGEEPRLVGYVVAPSHASPTAMREELSEHLPSYMVPSTIVVLDSFPIASSGKIDHKALPPPHSGDGRRAGFRPPSNGGEHELCAIWQEVLKIPKIGIDDDFFELGGTSLQALLIFAQIETRLDCSLSPTTIVQAPTIAQLAKHTQQTTQAAASQSLVPLRAGTTTAPIFLVHNKYCFVVYYRHLVGALKPGRPVFGLQPPQLDGKHHIPHTIEAIAAAYIAEIRRVQPHGPYLLAGHSFGGLVSFEIAQQLVREGEAVRFLGLMDTGARNVATETQRPVSRAAYFSHRIYDFFHKLKWTREAGLMRWRTLRLKLRRPIAYDARPAYYDRLCVRAIRDYVPKPYAGHITMFSSAGNFELQKTNWSPLAGGGLSIIEVPADHDHMVLPPYCKLLAEHLDACLEATEREGHPRRVAS